MAEIPIFGNFRKPALKYLSIHVSFWPNKISVSVYQCHCYLCAKYQADPPCLCPLIHHIPVKPHVCLMASSCSRPAATLASFLQLSSESTRNCPLDSALHISFTLLWVFFVLNMKISVYLIEFKPFPSWLAAYLSSLLEDCILVSGALVDQGELLCKVLPPWPLLFQQKKCLPVAFGPLQRYSVQGA